MGLLSTIFDILVSFGEAGAKSIDRKSDKELEDQSMKKFMATGKIDDYKTADELRDMAAKTHELAERRKNNKDGNK